MPKYELGHAPLREPSLSRALIRCNAQFEVVAWDAGAEELFGWSAAEARGAPYFSLITSEPSARAKRMRRLRRERTFAAVAQMGGKHDVVAVAIRARTLGDARRPTGFIAEFVRRPAMFRPQFAGQGFHSVPTLSRRANWQRPAGPAESYGMEAAGSLDKRSVIGSNIRRARGAANMSQAQLARQLGVDAPRISQYEHGRHEPGWDRLAEIARLTGVEGPGWFYVDHPDDSVSEDQ